MGQIPLEITPQTGQERLDARAKAPPEIAGYSPSCRQFSAIPPVSPWFLQLTSPKAPDRTHESRSTRRHPKAMQNALGSMLSFYNKKHRYTLRVSRVFYRQTGKP